MSQVIKIRNGIESAMVALSKDNKLSNKEIIDETRKRFGPEIAVAADELIDMALKALIKAVGNRTSTSRRFVNNASLFEEYPGITPTMCIREHLPDGSLKTKRRQSLSAKISDIRETISSRTSKPRMPSKRDRMILKLLSDVKPYQKSEDDTLEQAYAAMKASKE